MFAARAGKELEELFPGPKCSGREWLDGYSESTFRTAVSIRIFMIIDLGGFTTQRKILNR